jgi:hypothetical protein
MGFSQPDAHLATVLNKVILCHIPHHRRHKKYYPSPRITPNLTLCCSRSQPATCTSGHRIEHNIVTCYNPPCNRWHISHHQGLRKSGEELAPLGSTGSSNSGKWQPAAATAACVPSLRAGPQPCRQQQQQQQQQQFGTLVES